RTGAPYYLIMTHIVPDDKFRNGFASIRKIILNKEWLLITELYFKINVRIVFYYLIKLRYRMSRVTTARFRNHNQVFLFSCGRYHAFCGIVRLDSFQPAVHLRAM